MTGMSIDGITELVSDYGSGSLCRDLIGADLSGVAVLDERGRVLEANDALLRILGFSRSEFGFGSVLWPDLAAPEARPAWEAAIARAREGVVTAPMESVCLRKDGGLASILTRLRPLPTRPPTIACFALDITDYRRIERERNQQVRLALAVGSAFTRDEDLKSILKSCTDLIVAELGVAFARIWTYNSDNKMLELQVSSGIYTHTDGGHSRIPVGAYKIGRIAESRQPHLTNDVTHDPHISDPEWARREGMVAFAGYPLLVADRLVGVLGMFSRQPLSASTLDTLAAIASTISQGIEWKRTADERDRLLAERLALLEMEETRTFLHSIVENLPVMLFIKDAATLRFVHWNRAAEEIVGITRDEVLGKTDFDLFSKEDASIFATRDRHVLATGQPLDRWSEYLRTPDRGVRLLHTRMVPLLGQDGTPRYLLGISEDITEQREAEDQLRRAREREVEIGFRIQRTLLLNQPPDVPGLSIAAITLPSQTIDGDFYDFFRYRDCCLDVMVGDVMGKGIPAALLGAAAKSRFVEVISELVASGGFPAPAEIVNAAHQSLVSELVDLNSFITLSYARFDLDANTIDLVNCGHMATLHCRARDGGYELIPAEQPPLGIDPELRYASRTFPIEPGDLLLFYSDGLIDVRNSEGEFFGVERMVDFVLSRAGREPDELINKLRNAIVSFANTAAFRDDLTCVAVRFDPRPAPLAYEEREFQSDLRQLGEIRRFLRECCSSSLDPRRFCELELAVNEAASNIIKHAYRSEPTGAIAMRASTFPEHIVVRLVHFGETFDPATVLPPALDGSQESGFGLYLIGQCVDQVLYTSEHDGAHSICLTKRRRDRRHGVNSG